MESSLSRKQTSHCWRSLEKVVDTTTELKFDVCFIIIQESLVLSTRPGWV